MNSLTIEDIKTAIDGLNPYEGKAIILTPAMSDRKGILEKAFPGIEVVVNSLVPEDQVYIVNKLALDEILKSEVRGADVGRVTDREESHAQA